MNDERDSGTRAPGMFFWIFIALGLGFGLGWLVRPSGGEPPKRPPLVAKDAKPVSVTPLNAATVDKTPAETCQGWADQLCDHAGKDSEGCTTARTAAQFLPASACQAATQEMRGTVERLDNLKTICVELAARLCADLGGKTKTCSLMKQKLGEAPPSQCRQMNENYGQLLAQLKREEAKNAPLTPELAARNAAGTGPSFGPADAKVTVVEYSDFECPHCARAAQVTTQLKKRYGDRIRIVFRQFPLSFHKNAMPAAQASLAAHAQGKFWEFHDRLFANQRALTRPDLERYAQALDLDMDRFRAALDQRTYEKAVNADLALGQVVGVSGTPSMFVGAKRVQNPGDVSLVSRMIDEQLRAAGVPLPK